MIGDFFTFTRNRRSACTIVVGSKSDKEEMDSACVLVNAIRELSGTGPDVIEQGEIQKTDGLVLIGTLRSNPIIEEILAEESVITTKKEIEASGYVRKLSSEDLGPQGFVIYKPGKKDGPFSDSLVLTANTSTGLFYAVSTLVDRLHNEDGRLIVDGLNTRLIPVVNLPAFAHRSVFTGLGGPEWMGPGQYMKEFGYDYKAFIDWLSEHKFNNLLIHNFANLCWGINYESDRFPELINRFHPNVKQEFMGELIRYAHERHIEIFFGMDIPDNWSGFINVYPDLAGANVDWEYFPRGQDWDAFAEGTGDWRYNWIEHDASGNRIVHGEKGRQVRRQASWVCLTQPRVKAFWRDYWTEVLDRYPEVDGIGGQFSEHLNICNCERCSRAGFFDLATEYFGTMEELARSRNPDLKLWLWGVPGVRDIIKRKSEIPNLVLIDWGLSFQPFFLNQIVPKSDWYLCHGGGQILDFAIKRFCTTFNRLGLKGVQIRGVEFKEGDRNYQSFEEFMWNPQLSLEDYAHHYTIKQLRKKDKKVTDAYYYLIKAQGYSELLSYQGGEPGATTWCREEQYTEKFETALKRLKEILEGISTDHPFVRWLRVQGEIIDSTSPQPDHPD